MNDASHRAKAAMHQGNWTAAAAAFGEMEALTAKTPEGYVDSAVALANEAAS